MRWVIANADNLTPLALGQRQRSSNLGLGAAGGAQYVGCVCAQQRRGHVR